MLSERVTIITCMIMMKKRTEKKANHTTTQAQPNHGNNRSNMGTRGGQRIITMSIRRRGLANTNRQHSTQKEATTHRNTPRASRSPHSARCGCWSYVRESGRGDGIIIRIEMIIRRVIRIIRSKQRIITNHTNTNTNHKKTNHQQHKYTKKHKNDKHKNNHETKSNTTGGATRRRRRRNTRARGNT